MPYGFRISSKAWSLSGCSTHSNISDVGPTSVTRAENTSASRIRSARSVGCAATRTIISSRSIASSDVISFTFRTLISL